MIFRVTTAVAARVTMIMNRTSLQEARSLVWLCRTQTEVTNSLTISTTFSIKQDGMFDHLPFHSSTTQIISISHSPYSFHSFNLNY